MWRWLDYLKTLLWEACKCITIRRKEIELQCYHELFGDCFIKYDEDHIDDDELDLCPVVVENGKVVDILENHPRAYEYIERYYQTRYGPLDATPSADDEDDYWDYSYLLKNAKNDEERMKIANDLYRFELNTSFNHQQEQSAIGTTVIHDGWQESIFDYGQPILNQRFGDKLIENKRPIKRALDSIKEYCEHEMGTPRAFDELLKYTYPLAEEINHKIFAQDVNGENLAEVFAGVGHTSLTLLPRKETALIRILVVLSKKGPKVCRESEWLHKTAGYWGLSGKLYNRAYGKPSNNIAALINRIEIAFEKIS